MRHVRYNLKELKKAAYGYQSEIAEKLGISKQSTSMKINGHRPLSFDELNAICEVVRRDPADFITFDETKKAA